MPSIYLEAPIQHVCAINLDKLKSLVRVILLDAICICKGRRTQVHLNNGEGRPAEWFAVTSIKLPSFFWLTNTNTYHTPKWLAANIFRTARTTSLIYKICVLSFAGNYYYYSFRSPSWPRVSRHAHESRTKIDIPRFIKNAWNFNYLIIIQ